MDRGTALLLSKSGAHVEAEPCLKLLLEVEPAYRVFLRNLVDTLLVRPAPRVAGTSKPAPFWNDVFIDSPVPWRSLGESILWHVVAVVAVWSLNQGPKLQTFPQRHSFKGSYVVYYTPSETFPAMKANPPRVQSRQKAQPRSVARQAWSVAREHGHTIVRPPNIKSGMSAPNLAAMNSPDPAMPLSATARSQFSVPASPTSIVAPPPEVYQTTGRRGGLPQASVVAPPPDAQSLQGQRALSGPGAGVVAPPPTVRGSIRKFGDIHGAQSEVVSPPPALPMHEGRGGSGVQSAVNGVGAAIVPPPPSVGHSGTLASARSRSLSGTGSQIVPPPPSFQGVGNSTITRRYGPVSGTGAQIVPPPPSFDGVGNSGGGRRVASLSGTGSQIVPPPPSVQGMGSSNGGRQVGSLSGTGSQIVPPPPSARGIGNAGGSGRISSLGGTGSQVVPPPPTVQSAGGSGGTGRAGTFPGAGSSVVPPPPSVQGVGNSAGDGRMASAGIPSGAAAASASPVLSANNSMAGVPLPPMDIPPNTPPSAPPTVVKPAAEPGEDVPLRLIGVPLAMPGSSFFSNYEVYLAERRLRKGEFQLIKLVYEFLPYQKRLSEYVQDKKAKVYKLRVRRDETCDESLMQMSWPDQDPSGAQSSALPQVPSSADRNSLLPCYRTTADDYRRAVTQAR